MTKRRLLFFIVVALGLVSCSRPSRWSRADSANGALFVSNRPDGESVKVSIRSTRPAWVFITLTPDSVDGGSFPVDPPISVTMTPSEIAGPPFELKTTDIQREFFPSVNQTCSPSCDLDLDLVLKRDVPAGTPPIAVRWTLLASISGDEEKAPDSERITVVFR